MRTVNELIVDRSIRHMVLLERLKESEVRKIITFLNRQVIPDLQSQLNREIVRLNELGMSTSIKLRLLQSRLADMSRITQSGMHSARQRLEESSIGISQTEAEFVRRMVEAATPINIGLTLPATSVLQDVVTRSPIHGRLLGEWFDGLAQSTQTRLTQQLRIHIVEGETLDDGVRRVRDVLDMTRRDASAIVRTTVTHVTSAAREVTYVANTDIIKAVQYVATLDDRTSMICAGLDGQVFPIDSGPRPPQHVNCRSTTVPVLRSWRELGLDLKDAPEGTRESMNGQVAARTTYGQWLKRQPASVQNEVLGETRAQLFRNGTVTIDRFTDSRQNVLTLEELRKREGLN